MMAVALRCITLTKNEADIVAHCLSEAGKWAEAIYVCDGGSTDGTWEIVKELAKTDRRITPWCQRREVFHEGIRADVFNEFRHLAKPGDWWLQLNADEFYPTDPRRLLAGVPAADHFVWGIGIDYHLTDLDLRQIDFRMRIEERLAKMRYYRVNWSEPRAFRYRKRLSWRSDAAWPDHVGPTATERLLFKHFPLRSPEQIQMRLDVRREHRAQGFQGWRHASEETWQEKIVSAESCIFDGQDGKYAVDESVLPGHIESRPRRIIKRVLHGVGIWP